MSSELTPNTTLTHYRIVSKLGAGGMGEVWLAEDTRLGRKVALKLLPAEFTEDSERVRRFTQEAKAASALNHPNIIAVHDIGECEAGRFIVMEFVAGLTVRTVIAKDNSLETLFTLGGQMAKALSAAHAVGITHRDIKPDNIMVRDDGYVKMLDFGLARLLPTTSSDPEAMTLAQQTTPGTVMGTLAYMSPEQASGQIVGSASDVFALGIVLYELATGSHPFKSETMIGYLHAITSQTPPSMTSIKSHLPAALDDLILRMLEKDAGLRPTASEVAQALQEIEKYGSSNTLPLRVVAEKPKAKRGDEGCWIGVLPFKVRDADPDVAVLADGLSEEVVTGLSRFRYLSVVTSTSGVHLKGDTKNDRALSGKLGTRYVLEGSIRKGGSVIRVSVQLVDTETGAQLWSETYNRDLQTTTVFVVQDDVAGRIVATVADSYGVLVHSMRAALGKKDDADLTPFEWQFQYFAYREQITPAAHAALKSRLQRVAEQNVGQSDVWACLAQIYVDEYAFGFEGDAKSLDRALAAGRRAVELDRANQFALVALAQVHFFRQDLAAFGPAAERGMALNPLNTDAIGILGLQLVHTGQFERGTAIVHRAMELNPNHAGWMHFAPLWDHFHKGEYEQALECANRVDVPGLFWPYLVMASACGHLGRRTEAEAAIKDLLALDPEFAAHVRSNVESWHFASGLLEPLLDGLRKAGVEISDKEPRPKPATPTLASTETRTDDGFWVAVLPFKYRGNNPDLEALTEGLSEDIVAALSRFSCLRVIARSSTLRFTSESTDVRSMGQQLGARYVIEGSLRQVGTMLRLVVQLLDASTGAHLWAETYDRTIEKDHLFALQDDLVPRIVSTVADWYGVLTHSMSEAVRLKPIDQVTPYEAVLRSFGYYERVNAEEHAAARSALERAVEQAPGNADGWAMLSMMYGEEFRFGFNELPDAMGRSLKAARRAVDIAPSNHFAHLALAQAFFFRKEFDAFRHAAERAIVLNPMDGSTMEYMSHLIAFSGDWEYGCEVAERARQLNPNHPGWYWAVPFYKAYRNGDYPTARAFALKIDQPTVDLCQVMLAAVYGQLGEHEAAERTVQTLLSLTPDPAVTKKQLDKWYQPELVEKLIEGLRKAGLNIDDQTASSPSRHPSTESKSSDGFWVAVLPFKFIGSNAEVATLADGLTEEIVTGLSRFSYLRVISRSSTSRFAIESSDIRTIGKTLGARYVIEGSLRLAGSLLRLSVQLVDASTGAHLWAENYERPFRAEEIFALQDDLAPRVVSTVADQYGALVHSMSESLRGKSAGQYSAHEAAMRTFGYWERMTPDEHAEVRDILEAAVAAAPDHGDCLAELSMIYWHEYAFGYNLRPDPVGRARAVAQRAVAAAPSSHFAHCALATSLFFQKDFLAFRPAAERALALNRMDASTMELLGQMIAYAGDWEYGLKVVERAMQLNPHHPGWYHYLTLCDKYRKHDYHGALASALKVNMPAYHWPHVYLAAVYGQLGEQQRGSEALRRLHALIPNFGAIAREEMSKWLDAELTEHLIDGLRKAGLEIVDEDRPADTSSGLQASDEKQADEGFWVAVLPFKATGTDVVLSTFAEGLSDEIVTGLNRFSYLRVIARGSTLRYASQTSDMRTVGKTLGARYVMEGNVRQVSSVIRVTVQLVDANNGVQLWTETYDRAFKPNEIFALQDDLVPRIVSTVADQHGVLPHSMSEVVRAQDPEQLTAYETLIRGFRYYEGVSPSEHATIRAALERALETSPGSADCWAMLGIMYCDEHKFGFNQLPDSLGRALNAAQRAVEISPTNPFAYEALSQALFFRKEFDSFRNAAERAIALNPMDGATNAFMGILIAFTGDWDYGCAVAERATQLNPHHPGWYWNAAFYDAYRKRDYENALKVTLEFSMPGLFYHHVNRAAVYGQLGDREAAGKALEELLALKPDFASTAPDELGKWLRPELVDHVIQGLHKAGLDIGEAEASAITSSTPAVSSLSRADEGFWVAVLPFKFTGSNTEVGTLAEGLSEEIVTGLSRFSYLRVISRSSTLRYAKETDDVRAVGKTLGARYVMEGSLRIAGSSLRISVQLIDAGTGAHLWAETYDRQFRAEEIFALQDDLVPRIVSTVADVNGVLPRSMSEVVCRKNPDELSPYEAVLRSFRYFDRVTAEELASAQSCLELALEKAPTFADAWAMLALLFVQDYGQGFNLHPDALNSGTMAAQRAVEAGPSNHLAYFSLAQARFFQKDIQSFRNAAERAVALNPMDANSVAFMGELLTYVGDSERGLALATRAKEINPNHPGWFWYADYFHAYRLGDYRSALSLVLKANLPGHWGMHAGIAAAAGQLGDHETASKAIRDLLKLRPDYGTSVHKTLAKWFDPELCEQLLNGLRKAGLQIAGECERFE